MEKKEIRSYVIQERKKMSDADCKRLSAQICETIIAMPEFQQASCVCTYMDFNHEVMMKTLIEEAWKLGKRVAAPRVNGDTMDYFYIRSYEDVKPGCFHVPEPDAVNPLGEEDENALLIVPGVGFDRNRNRCGYGKGYYDKYLSAHPDHPTVAAAFEFQLVDEVPANQFDIKPQRLVTEVQVYS